MTETAELSSILRDIAAGRRNAVGDYWHTPTYAAEAATKLEALEERIEELERRLRRVKRSVS